MDEKPHSKSRVAPAMIVAGALCALLVGYAWSYLSTDGWDATSNGDVMRIRELQSKAACTLFSPAARIEAIVSGVPVIVRSNYSPTDYDFYEP